MRRAAALLTAALVAGCSAREHANPFDPENPSTGGRPAGFVALAGTGLVELRWTSPAIEGDFQFQLFRRIQGESEFQALGSRLPGSTTSYFDFGLTNGLLHEYRLYYVFSGQPGGLPADDAGTPGPLRPWCADLSRRTLIESTPDGRHVLTETGGFLGPTFVAVDSTQGAVWVSDTYDGQVVVINPTSPGSRRVFQDLTEPVAIALDPIDQSAWVCDQGRNALYHFPPASVPGTGTRISDVLKPIGVACDPGDGTVWVCERGRDQVRRFSRTGTPLTATPLAAPSRVAVDSLNGDAWVTSLDGARVVRFSAAGAAQDTVPLAGPVGIAVDARRGRIWVADTRLGQVIALRRSGQVEFTVRGLPLALEVAVDLATGEAWATVSGLQAIVRISPGGAVLRTLGGLSDPYGIALDPGRR
ncbi:MAG TPA: NHL repeat-containing protein [Candidatus Eisenbacteria bacterium]|jgi:DNA-binding beta-propeller fold protein YncE